MLVQLVLDHFKLKKPSFIGFDSGAGCGMKMALKNKNLFKAVIADHMNYNEDSNGELSQFKTPFLALNDQDDELHSWKRAKELTKKIPKGIQVAIKSKQYYAEYSEKIIAPVIKHLTGIDYSKAQEDVHKMKEEKKTDIHGNKVTAQ